MTKIIKAFHPTEHIVTMITSKGYVYVATNRMVYKIIDDVLVKLTAQLVEDDGE